MAISELVWCADGPNRGFCERVDLEDSGYLWFRGSEFGSGDAWYQRTEQMAETKHGDAVIFTHVGDQLPKK
jgi:hypothetical protein